MNKFLANLLSDSDEESDGESFLEKYRKGKRDQAPAKKEEVKQEEAKQEVEQLAASYEEIAQSDNNLDTLVAEEEKKDMIEDDLHGTQQYVNLG